MAHELRVIKYGIWLSEIDAIISERLGCVTGELVEAPLPQWFMQGIEPKEAAVLCEDFAV